MNLATWFEVFFFFLIFGKCFRIKCVIFEKISPSLLTERANIKRISIELTWNEKARIITIISVWKFILLSIAHWALCNSNSNSNGTDDERFRNDETVLDLGIRWWFQMVVTLHTIHTVASFSLSLLSNNHYNYNEMRIWTYFLHFENLNSNENLNFNDNLYEAKLPMF